MTRSPNAPPAIKSDVTALQFRTMLLMCAGAAVVFALSWKQVGIWPLLENAALSISLMCAGAALLFTLRAQTLMSSSVRPWMRPTAIGMLVFALVVGGSTFWRWRTFA